MRKYREYKITGTLREIHRRLQIFMKMRGNSRIEILYSLPISDFVYDKIRTGYRPLVDNPLLRDKPGVYKRVCLTTALLSRVITRCPAAETRIGEINPTLECADAFGLPLIKRTKVCFTPRHLPFLGFSLLFTIVTLICAVRQL